MTPPGSDTAAWQTRFGLRYNPFAYYEASRDPYLVDYLVGHAVFESAWMPAPSLILAPAGGGKTATRIYTARACWNGVGSRRPLPLVYKPALGALAVGDVSLATHYTELLGAAAQTLFCGLLAEPDRLLEQPRALQEQICRCLSAHLPYAADFYLQIVHSAGTLSALRPYLQLDVTPAAAAASEKLAALAQLLAAYDPAHPWQEDAQASFFWLCDVLTTALQYRSLFVLVDGVDALPETNDSPAAAAAWLQPLLRPAAAWAERDIYLKCFLPAEYAPWLQTEIESGAFLTARIEWLPATLVPVLRNRIHTASNGVFDGMGAISSPDLHNLEEQVCSLVEPLPREAVMFMDHLLRHAASEQRSSPITLVAEDYQATAAWYETQRAAVRLT